MDEDIKSLLKQNIEATHESLRILKKVHSLLYWQRAFSLIKWFIFIIILAIGFVKLEPYLGVILKDYENIFKALEHINTILPGTI